MRSFRNISSLTIVIYFVLAMIFAACSMLASRLPGLQYTPTAGTFVIKNNLNWIFWLFIVLSTLCVLPLLNALLYQLHLRKALPRALAELYEEETSSEKEGFFHWLKKKVGSEDGRIILVGMAIFAPVFILSLTNAVRENDVDSYIYEYISRVVGKRAFDRMESPPVTHGIFFYDRDNAKYLKGCLSIVEELKRVGARAVLVDIRDIRWGERNQDVFPLLKKMENTGIAVLGLPMWSDLRIADSTGEFAFSKGRMTMQPFELRLNPFLFRVRLQDKSSGNKLSVPDISVELLRKYHRYSRAIAPATDAGVVEFGDYRLPVDADEWMYARQSSAVYMERTIVVSYMGDSSANLRFSGVYSKKNFSDPFTLEDLKGDYEGKIVFIVRGDPTSMENGWLLGNSYRSVLESIVSQTVVVRSQTLHIWLTILCIVCAGFIASRFRPMPALLSIFALGVVILLGTWLVYQRFYLLVDVFYPLLATGMSMFIFPALRVAETPQENERQALS